MRRHGIRALAGRRFKPCTTDSRHYLPIAPNLLQQNFLAAAPNRIWLTDITYIPTGEGWLYLAAVLDLATRKIVGWAMRDHMRTELPLAALIMAAHRQRPALGLIHHSDRGSQYAAGAYVDQLAMIKATPSMSRTGNCYDNAPMESFFHTLKVELVHQCRWATNAEARQALFGYIEGYYNRHRMHSALGYLTPEQAEQRKMG
jgi:putative transposase